METNYVKAKGKDVGCYVVTAHEGYAFIKDYTHRWSRYEHIFAGPNPYIINSIDPCRLKDVCIEYLSNSYVPVGTIATPEHVTHPDLAEYMIELEYHDDLYYDSAVETMYMYTPKYSIPDMYRTQFSKIVNDDFLSNMIDNMIDNMIEQLINYGPTFLVVPTKPKMYNVEQEYHLYKQYVDGKYMVTRLATQEELEQLKSECSDTEAYVETLDKCIFD